MHIDHTKNIIEIRNLSFSYNETQILNNINLDIHQGDYLGIIGPNGGGKTTLLKLILGLLQPTSGSVTFTQSTNHKHSPLGYIAQKSTNFDTKFPITVKEVVALGLSAHKPLFQSLNSKDHELIRWSLDQVGVSNLAHKLIGNLSGGQQQRVFIARTLVQRPSIIFLDEPTSGIDPASQEQFYQLLKKMNQNLGITLVLVSHDIDVVRNEVTEIACINQGLVYHGAPSDLKEKDHLHKLYTKDIKFISHKH